MIVVLRCFGGNAILEPSTVECSAFLAGKEGGAPRPPCRAVEAEKSSLINELSLSPFSTSGNIGSLTETHSSASL